MFIGPAIILLLALLVYPVIWTIRLSFDTGRGLEPREWVGFENYTRLFTEDRRFLNLHEFPPQGALVNNVLWLVLYTSVCLAIGLLIAVLATRVRYEAVIKAIIFVPMAISAVAVGLIWKFVYSPDADIGVPDSYLEILLAPFADPKVGIVTCPYRSVGGATAAARTDALLTNTGGNDFTVSREIRYVSGHRELDRAYSWGLNWTAGRK